MNYFVGLYREILTSICVFAYFAYEYKFRMHSFNTEDMHADIPDRNSIEGVI